MTMRMSIPTEEHLPAPSLADRVVTRWRLFVRNLWRSGVLPLMPVIVGIGIWYSMLLMREGVVLWHDVSTSTAMTYAIVGPLCAALAAWTSGRPQRRKVNDQLASTPVPGWQQDLLSFSTAAGLGVIGYGGMVLVMTGWAATQATWGAPYAIVLLSGLPVVVLFCLFGAAVGMLWPNHLASLLVLIVTGGSMIFGNTIQNWGPEANARELTLWNTLLSLRDGLSEWEDRRSAPELFENMLMASGLGVLVVTLTLFIRYRGPFMAVSLAVAAVLAGVGVTASMSGQRSDLMFPWSGTEPTASFDYACTAGESVDVCLHPAWTSLQSRVEESAEAIYGPVEGLSDVPDQIIQVPAIDREARGETGKFYILHGSVSDESLAIYLISSLFPDLYGDPERLSDAERTIVGWLMHEAGSEPTFFLPWGRVSQDNVIAHEQELHAAVDRFAALSPEEQRAWLEANWDDLRAGRLTLEDLP
jgi:hypothetical protein